MQACAALDVPASPSVAGRRVRQVAVLPAGCVSIGLRSHQSL